MGRNATEIERIVARTLRDSLEKLQRSTEEVNQTVGDLVSACSSTRPSNTLPHLLRAQTAAASLAATLDVLSRFITSAIQPGWGAPFLQPEPSLEAEPGAAVESDGAVEAAADFTASVPLPESLAVEPSPRLQPAPAAVAGTVGTVVAGAGAFERIAIEQPSSVEPQVVPLVTAEVARQGAQADAAQSELQIPEPEPLLERPFFEVTALPADQQELHRRANRVAKVSMQDIKMLRPGDVRAGKENNDLCERLRDDIERAHKEYERRFYAILEHPVDYFYVWMVEILGEGDPRALGEYPYSSPVARR